MSLANQSTLAMRATGTAFEILYAPRSIPDSATPPAKTGPKTLRTRAERSAISLETPEERKTRRTAEVLRQNKQSNISYSTRNADKTNKIIGRRLNARSQ